MNPFIHTSLHAGVPRKESLVWFEAPGLCYTINAGPSLGLSLDILLLPCVVKILQSWVHRTDTLLLPQLQQIIHGVDVGAGQHITLVLGLSSCRIGQPVSSSLSSPPGGALQHCPG